MKSKIVFIAFIVLASTSISFSQHVQEQRVKATEKAIPPLVLKTFNDQYPKTQVKSWYVTHITYWYNDISSGWYNDWYGPRTVVIYSYEQPNYFEVEFIDTDGLLCRAIYNKYGYWYETRARISALPLNVLESFMQSKYSDWKKSNHIEKIETAEWPDTVYRFKVTKGLKSKIIRMNNQGVIIQEKVLGY